MGFLKLGFYLPLCSVSLAFGDPQTPEWPSLKQNEVHQSEKLDHAVSNIPVQPIGYDAARRIITALGIIILIFNVYT